MIIDSEELVWESTDATTLKSFLGSTTGQRLLSVLAYGCPEFSDGTNGNKALVAAGKVEGYQLAVKHLLRAQVEHPEEPAAPPSYPPLDDDSAWEGKPVDEKNKS
jgi:hypothetical protein